MRKTDGKLYKSETTRRTQERERESNDYQLNLNVVPIQRHAHKMYPASVPNVRSLSTQLYIDNPEQAVHRFTNSSTLSSVGTNIRVQDVKGLTTLVIAKHRFGCN